MLSCLSRGILPNLIYRDYRDNELHYCFLLSHSPILCTGKGNDVVELQHIITLIGYREDVQVMLYV